MATATGRSHETPSPFLTAAFLAGAVSFPAQAQLQAYQPGCASHADVLNHLADKYSEAPVAMGLASNGGVIEVLSSKTGESWTIIITMPNGTACMIAGGKGWQMLPLKPTTTGFQT